MIDSKKAIIFFTIFLSLGIAIGKFFSIALFISISLFLIAFVITYLIYHYEHKEYINIGFCLIFIFLGIILITNREILAEKKIIKWVKIKPLKIWGKVLSPPEERLRKGYIIIKIYRINKNFSYKYKNYKAILHYNKKKGSSFTDKLREGNVISFIALPLAGKKAQNPGQFDIQEFYKKKGYSISLYLLKPQKLKVVKKESLGIWGPIFKVRRKLTKVIKEILPKTEGSLLIGMILGRRKELPVKLEEAFRNSGTMHILAASGLQVTLITGTFLFLFSLFKFKSKIRFLLIIPLLIFYALLASASPSIVRATIMGIVYLLSSVFEKDYDPLITLFISAFILLIGEPYYLFDIGFQLSFIAVLGIIVMYKPLRDKFYTFKEVKKYLSNKLPLKISSVIAYIYEFLIASIIISIVAQCSVIPILAYHFNHFTFMGLISNIILVPLTNFCIIVGLIGGLIGVFIFPLGQFVIFLITIPVKLSVTITYILGSFPWSTIRVPSPGFLSIIFYYSFLLILTLKNKWIKLQRKKIIFIFIIFTALFILIKVREQNKIHKIVCFNTKNFNVALLQKKDLNCLWIYGKKLRGRKISFELYKKIMPYLKKNGIYKINIMVIQGENGALAPNIKKFFEQVKIDKIFISPLFKYKKETKALFIKQRNKSKMYLLRGTYKIFAKKYNINIEAKINRLTYRWKKGRIDIFSKEPSLQELFIPKDYRKDRVYIFSENVKKKLVKDLLLIGSGKEKIVSFSNKKRLNKVLYPRIDGAIIIDISCPNFKVIKKFQN